MLESILVLPSRGVTINNNNNSGPFGQAEEEEGGRTRVASTGVGEADRKDPLDRVIRERAGESELA